VKHRHPVNQQLIDGQSRTDRAVDRFVTFFGSLKFIVYMTVVIIAWLAVNSLWLTKGLRWDPYPFILLNLVFSAQATYAAPLILLSQNRAAEHDRLKAEADYQTNETALTEIRADRELTKEVHDLTAEVHRLVTQAALAPVPDLAAAEERIIAAVKAAAPKPAKVDMPSPPTVMTPVAPKAKP
jgi:uncharacterized membrane protein